MRSWDLGVAGETIKVREGSGEEDSLNIFDDNYICFFQIRVMRSFKFFKILLHLNFF